MRFLQKVSICLIYAVVAVLFADGALGATPELPEGLAMNDTFKPGYGTPVGKVRLVQGNVIIMHTGQKEGYWAKKDTPLYEGDIIVTQKKSRTNLVMRDKSIISLSSNTRLVLTKSIYDEKKKSRSSFLRLTIGKARFVVSKLLSFKRREFKVKTVTAVCGVRGSKFIIVATDSFTEVTTEDKTKVAVYSAAKPDEPPVIVEDYQRTGVELGQVPYAVVPVPLEEIEMLKEDFVAPADEDMPDGDTDVQKEEASEEEDTSVGETEEEGDTEEAAATEGTGDDGPTSEDAGEDDAAEEGAASEEAQEDGAAEEDTLTEDAQEGEATEGETASGETQADESAAGDTEVDDTQAGVPTESETPSGEAQTAVTDDGAGGEIESTEGPDTGKTAAGAGVAATGKTVGVTTGAGDTAADVPTDQNTPSNVAPEGSITAEGTDVSQAAETTAMETDGAVDTGDVYVPDEVLVEPEVPTDLDQPVVNIEDIVVEVVEEPEMADQVAEQILQEDLEIPPMPGTPE